MDIFRDNFGAVGEAPWALRRYDSLEDAALGSAINVETLRDSIGAAALEIGATTVDPSS
jgi:hypothetical protein